MVAFKKSILLLFTFSSKNVSSCPHLRNGRNLQGFDVDIQALFENRHQIHRNVVTTEVGVESITTSTDEKVVTSIQNHVRDMMHLDEPIRLGDPLFASLFEHIDQTYMNVTFVADGVMVVHKATTDCGVLLVQDHAEQITRFIDTGIRRPNFDWKEPTVCKKPTLIHPANHPENDSDVSISDSGDPIQLDDENDSGNHSASTGFVPCLLYQLISILALSVAL